MEFAVEPALFEQVLVGGGFFAVLRVFAFVIEHGEDGFGGEHGGFDGAVDAFDAGDVEKACGVADDGGAGGGEFGQALQAAFGEGARAVGEAAAV